MTFPDAYIDRWGEVYTANLWLRRLCTFEQFLVRPETFICAALARRPTVGLLAKQRAVQRGIDHLEGKPA